MSLKIIFAGTPAFAVPSLQALIDSPHQVIAVYTQPDRPMGRGQKVLPGPIKVLAMQHHIPIYQPYSLKTSAEQHTLANLDADVMVVTAYGLLLPKAILAAPRYGAINVHPSLLPRWRGATPIQSALLAGDTHTGVSIIQLTAKMDAGPILYQTPYPIPPQANSADLHDELGKLGANALLHTLDLLVQHDLNPQVQDEAQVTYTHKISKADALINWQLSATQIALMVRSYNPWPIAFCYFQGKILRVWQAEALNAPSIHPPGTLQKITADSLEIATSSGILRLLQVQSPGGRILSVADFICGQRQNLLPGITQFELG